MLVRAGWMALMVLSQCSLTFNYAFRMGISSLSRRQRLHGPLPSSTTTALKALDPSTFQLSVVEFIGTNPFVLVELALAPVAVILSQLKANSEMQALNNKVLQLESAYNQTTAEMKEIDSDMRDSLTAYKTLYDAANSKLDWVIEKETHRQTFEKDLLSTVDSVSSFVSEVSSLKDISNSMSQKLEANQKKLMAKLSALETRQAKLAAEAIANQNINARERASLRRDMQREIVETNRTLSSSLALTQEQISDQLKEFELMQQLEGVGVVSSYSASSPPLEPQQQPPQQPLQPSVNSVPAVVIEELQKQIQTVQEKIDSAVAKISAIEKTALSQTEVQAQLQGQLDLQRKNEQQTIASPQQQDMLQQQQQQQKQREEADEEKAGRLALQRGNEDLLLRVAETERELKDLIASSQRSGSSAAKNLEELTQLSSQLADLKDFLAPSLASTQETVADLQGKVEDLVAFKSFLLEEQAQLAVTLSTAGLSSPSTDAYPAAVVDNGAGGGAWTSTNNSIANSSTTAKTATARKSSAGLIAEAVGSLNFGMKSIEKILNATVSSGDALAERVDGIDSKVSKEVGALREDIKGVTMDLDETMEEMGQKQQTLSKELRTALNDFVSKDMLAQKTELISGKIDQLEKMSVNSSIAMKQQVEQYRIEMGQLVEEAQRESMAALSDQVTATQGNLTEKISALKSAQSIALSDVTDSVQSKFEQRIVALDAKTSKTLSELQSSMTDKVKALRGEVDANKGVLEGRFELGLGNIRRESDQQKAVVREQLQQLEQRVEGRIEEVVTERTSFRSQLRRARRAIGASFRSAAMSVRKGTARIRRAPLEQQEQEQQQQQQQLQGSLSDERKASTETPHENDVSAPLAPSESLSVAPAIPSSVKGEKATAVGAAEEPTLQGGKSGRAVSAAAALQSREESDLVGESKGESTGRKESRGESGSERESDQATEGKWKVLSEKVKS